MAVVNAIQDAMGTRKRDIFIVLNFQLILLILFGIFARYDQEYEARVYPMFQDVHVMIFIGFGFLMTFLKRYGFSAVGFNFLLAALVIQWAIICEGFFRLETGVNEIKVSVSSLLKADVAAASVLISMGAVLGKTSYVQLLVMGVIEIAVFAGNSHLGSEVFKVSDAGDSIFVHAFGAYFGLGVSYILGRIGRNNRESIAENTMEGSSYTSDLFAMIGTVFLWMFWPSFNSAELEGDQQHRAIINTYLSLASCCVTAFAVSSAFTPGQKFDMVHIQNSTLAGGVAIGTSANLMVQPYGALIVGILAGALSVFGYSVLTPRMNKNMKIHDTCGVHNLHGMPGVLAGLIGALMAGIATENAYGTDLYRIFPARADVNGTTLTEHPFMSAGDGRSSSQQAGYQILAVVVTILVAIVSGLITGILITGPTTTQISEKHTYTDDISWVIHEAHEQPPIKVATIANTKSNLEMYPYSTTTSSETIRVY